jgi:hypothetical protein
MFCDPRLSNMPRKKIKELAQAIEDKPKPNGPGGREDPAHQCACRHIDLSVDITIEPAGAREAKVVMALTLNPAFGDRASYSTCSAIRYSGQPGVAFWR